MKLKQNVKEYHVVKFFVFLFSFLENVWLLFKNKEILYFLEKESIACPPKLI